MERKNIIMYENGKLYEYDNLMEMVRQILGKDYYQLSEKEKNEKLKLRTFMNAMMRGIPVEDVSESKELGDIEDEKYILLNEVTFLASLVKNKDIVVYEKITSNQFTQGIEKENLERVSKEYIRINDCANQILEREIKNAEHKRATKDKKLEDSDDERI